MQDFSHMTNIFQIYLPVKPPCISFRGFSSSEWAQVTYPGHDLREKGKDWKACLAVMNEGARHLRLKDRKRKVRTVKFLLMKWSL